MNKILKCFRPFFTNLSFAASYGSISSLSFWFGLEMISSAHIMYIILKASFPISQDDQSIILYYLKVLVPLMGVFDRISLLNNKTFVLIGWFSASLYLLAYVGYVMFILKLNQKEIIKSKKVTEIFTIVNILHSKVIFSPIHYFYLNFLSSQQKCSVELSQTITCHISLTVSTFFFIITNFALVFLKEILFYQVYENKNIYAVKNNTHGIIQIFHKTLVLCLLAFKERNVLMNSIFNFVLSLVYLLTLFVKLPIYNVKALKISIVLSTMWTAISFILVWKVILREDKATIFDLLILLLTPISIKLVLQRLNNLFEKIITGKYIFENHITHIDSLLNQENSKNEGCLVSNNYYSHKQLLLYNYGFVKSENFKATNLQDPLKLESDKNTIILTKILRSYKNNPKSITTLLFLTRFYAEKMKNIPITIIYMKKLQHISSSIPVACYLLYLKHYIRSILITDYSENKSSLEFANYFKYVELANKLKQTIQLETNKHVEFWKSFSEDRIDVYNVIQACRTLDNVALKIQKLWNENEKGFVSNFPVCLVMYEVYLSLVRNKPEQSQTLVKRFFGQNEKYFECIGNWFSQEKAVIFASNQKEEMGKVLDASYTVKNLFNIEKENLIGKKINLLMPKMIQEKHDCILQRYNENSTLSNNRSMSVYCKTIDGNFFLSDFKLRISPFIEKGVGLFGIFTKKEEFLPTLFIDVNGDIIDFSKDFLAQSGLNIPLNKLTNINEVSPKLERVNQAFNIVYCQQPAPEIKQGKKHTQETDRIIYSEASPILLETCPDSAKRLLLSDARNRKQLEYQLSTSPKSIKPLNNSNYEELTFDSPKMKEIESPKGFEIQRQDWFTEEIKNRIEFRSNLIEDSKKICERFEKGSYITFGAQNQNKLLIKVKPYFFENMFYKVINLVKEKNYNPRRAKDQHIKNYKTHENYPMSINKKALSRELKKETKLIAKKSNLNIDPTIPIGAEKSFGEMVESFSIDNIRGNQKARKVNYTFSLGRKDPDIDSRRINIIDSNLNNLCKIERMSNLLKLYYFVFYFAILLMISLAILDFVTIRTSFKQVELGAKLVNINSERISLLFQTWSSANLINMYFSRGMTFPVSSSASPPNIKDFILMVKQTERELVSLLEEVHSNEVLETFYRRDVRLWDPSDRKQVGSSLFSSFAASNMILQKLSLFTNENVKTIRDNPSLALFALNNTANDLLLSLETELWITQKFKSDICQNNLNLLKGLIIGNGISITVVLVSLLVLIIQMLRANQKLFRVLTIIPIEAVVARENKLFEFENCLQQTIESTKFVQNINSLVQQQNEKKDYNKMSVPKDEDNRFVHTRLRVVVLFFFSVALICFLLIFMLFFFSNHQSTQNIYKAQLIDEGSKIAEKIGYQTYLVASNFVYYVIFYNQSSMLFRNEPPGIQLDKNLDYMLTTNTLLMSTFSKEQIYDPDIEKLLLNDVCSYLEKTPIIQQFCQNSTKGEVVGLIGINILFHDFVSLYLDLFRSKPTFANFFNLIGPFQLEARVFPTTTDRAFRFLRTHLLDSLIELIENQEKSAKKYLVTICSSCFIVALVVSFVVLMV